MTTSPVWPTSSSPLPTPGRSSCQHNHNYALATTCGLCWLRNEWEQEVPKRLHDYEILADNGNPALHPRFLRHIELSLGLIPPKPEERLAQYRLARGRLYKPPDRQQTPITFALWDMMGYQPRLARPLVQSLLGREPEVIASELGLSIYGIHLANIKAIRYTFRVLRS